MRSGSQPKLCSRDTMWETSLNASRGRQENGNADEQAVVKNLPVPYIAVFWFGQISSHDEISVNKHCDCDTFTLVIRVDRPNFVSLVTTTRDIPRVEVTFPDWEMWPATVRSARISSTAFTLIEAVYDSLEIPTLRRKVLRAHVLIFGAARLCVGCSTLEIKLAASSFSVDFSSNAVTHSRRKNASNHCKFVR